MIDPIVEEVRCHRAEIAARNGNDIRRIFEDARSRQGRDGRRVVSFVHEGEETGSCVVREDPLKP